MADFLPFPGIRPENGDWLRPAWSASPGRAVPIPQVKQDRWAGLYLYAIEKDGQRFLGFFCKLRLAEFSTGIVQVGENIPQDAAPRPGWDPVWAAYDDPRGVTAARLGNLIRTVPPRYDRLLDGARHRLWVVNDPVAITALREDLCDRPLTLQRGLGAYRAALARRRSPQDGALWTDEGEFCFALLSAAGEADLPIQAGWVLYPEALDAGNTYPMEERG